MAVISNVFERLYREGLNGIILYYVISISFWYDKYFIAASYGRKLPNECIN